MSFNYYRVHGTQLVTSEEGHVLGWVTMYCVPGHTITFQLVDMNGNELGVFDTHAAAVEHLEQSTCQGDYEA